MVNRVSVTAAIGALWLALVTPAAATPPDRVAFSIDDTFQSGLLTRRCGIDVFTTKQGTGTATLFYDNSGGLVREIDVMPGGLRSTYYAPQTGKSFTETIHTPIIWLFPDGAYEGAFALRIVHGVQLTAGPLGTALVVGREVDEAIVTGISLDGIPELDVGNAISLAGQFDIEALIDARCALLTDP